MRRTGRPTNPVVNSMYKPNRNRAELLGDRANVRYAEVSEQVIEQQNNDYAAQLSQKVDMLKSVKNLLFGVFLNEADCCFGNQLSIDIGEEVKEQNKMLDGMHMDFNSAGQFLSSTMRKLSDMMASGGSKNMCYLALAAFFIFVLLYFLIGRKRS